MDRLMQSYGHERCLVSSLQRLKDAPPYCTISLSHHMPRPTYSPKGFVNRLDSTESLSLLHTLLISLHPGPTDLYGTLA